MYPISTNEFYYQLRFQDTENFSEKKSKELRKTSSSGWTNLKINHLLRFLLNSALIPAFPALKLPTPNLNPGNPIEKQAAKERNNSKRQKKKSKEEITAKASSVKMKTTREKFQTLSITVKNDKVKQEVKTSAGSSLQQISLTKKKVSVETLPMEDTNSMLNRLKLLQSGKISSENFQKSSPLSKPKKAEKSSQSIIQQLQAHRNKEEVQRLNLQIQAKIAQDIKPKLRLIIDRNDHQMLPNGLETKTRCKTYSESSQPHHEAPAPRPRHIVKPIREVPIVKTKVKLSTDEEAEIYRYTSDDLYQLQSKATYELVPRLMDLKIASTGQSELDVFLLKLLLVSDPDRRHALILDAAEKRKLINRVGPTHFQFSSVLESAQEKEKEETKQTPAARRSVDDDDVRKLSPEIERFRSIASNDDEYNELVYMHEFRNLFKDALQGQPALKNMLLPDIVKHLVDTNQAYIIEGEIRVNGKNNQEAYVSQPKALRDVCINKLILRQHAFQGDLARVLVRKGEAEDLNTSIEDAAESTLTDDDLDATLLSKVNPESRNFGCVLEILEKRHSRRVIGSLSSVGIKTRIRRNVILAVRDTKIPSVKIGRDGLPRDVPLSDKQLMVVEITGWSNDQPKGKVVEIIGEKGQLKTENVAILLQHNLNPQPFSQEIIDQVPVEPFVIPVEEFAYRQDLRKKCIFSIDPETARDLDDALSCEDLPNGNLEIGVHISDVSYFLKENSELDLLVKEKATTIYLVDTVYHMLPVPLCLLCSLLPGADKMAYSVFWEMNPTTAEIISTRFTRSVLNSCAKLSYDHAQAVIEKADKNWKELEADFPEIHNGFTVSDVANVIVKLQKIAIILRERRKENGTLKIDQPKIAFKFDRDDQRMEAPVDFFKYCTKDSNRLIEEFMLLANISIAKFIFEKFPEISLLRSHDPPNAGGMKKLVKTLQKHNISIDTSSSAALSASMERLIGSTAATAGMNAALNLLVSKTMTRARYLCSDVAEDGESFWHYALSIPMYTHFTSPIRRYADVLVHR